MRSKQTIIGLLIFFLFVLGAAGCDDLSLSGDDDGALRASGVVETVEVTAAAEIGGRIVEIYVTEGEIIQEGDLLFQLDDEIMQSERKQVVTALESAQANQVTALTGLEMAKATLIAAEAAVETVTANAEAQSLVAQKALDDLDKMHEVVRGQAAISVVEAERAVRDAQYRLSNYTIPSKQKDMDAIEAVDIMKAQLDVAQAAFEPYRYKESSDSTRQDLREDLDEAQSDYDSALRRLEYETDLTAAQAAQNKARQDYHNLQDGPDADTVAILEAQMRAAESAPLQPLAAVEQAKVGLSQAETQLDSAERAVAQAQAALDLVDTQITKLSVTAPVSGVVLLRNIQKGEVLNPGASALTIGQLDELTVTVYIPENRYGHINLGDHAKLTVDSFPDQVFNAVVVHIADKAEYTPRNVQTQEERSTTVFAIKLEVEDPEGRLKPGMPADVEFIP